MSKHQESNSSPIGSIVITSIICTTIIIVALYGFSLSYETLKQASEISGSQQNSEVNSAAAILQSNATIIVALITGVIGAGFGGYKIWKRLTTVEQQTNGRTHVRDAQIDALISEIRYLRNNEDNNTKPIVIAATKALRTSPKNNVAPEINYTQQEKDLTSQMLKISEELSNIRKQKEEENNE